MDNPWTGWRAIIGSTGHADSFGVLWRNAPAMERRGGYSGPYDKRQDADAARHSKSCYCQGFAFHRSSLLCSRRSSSSSPRTSARLRSSGS